MSLQFYVLREHAFSPDACVFCSKFLPSTGEASWATHAIAIRVASLDLDVASGHVLAPMTAASAALPLLHII